MPLSTLHLSTFAAVAEAGSFTRAADTLACVQSAVTSRIAALEREVGGALFVRSRSGVTLTPRGERLAVHARRILALHALAEADCRGVEDGPTHLRLGAMESTAAARLPAVLQRVAAARSDLRLALTTGTTDELVRAVEGGRLEAAFVAAPVEGLALAARPVFEERLVAIAARSGPVPAVLIAFRHGCAYRAVGERWWRTTGRGPFDFAEIGSLDAMIGCAAAGMGVAVVPERVAEDSRHRPLLSVEPLPDPLGRATTLLVARRDLLELPALADALDLLCEAATAVG